MKRASRFVKPTLLKNDKANVQVPTGRNWVSDAEPDAEFQETVNKSKAMLNAVALAETFAIRT